MYSYRFIGKCIISHQIKMTVDENNILKNGITRHGFIFLSRNTKP